MNFRNIVITILIAFTSLQVLIMDNVSASNDDEIFFQAQGKTGHSPENDTDTVYQGEDHITLIVLFSQNSTEWNIDLIHPLFLYNVSGVSHSTAKAGLIYRNNMEINSSSDFGDYNISVYFNYTDDDGNKIKRTYNTILHYIPTLEIKKIKKPTTNDKNFLIEVESFIQFDSLIVKFGSDGNIGIQDSEQDFQNLPPGNYSFRTGITQIRAPIYDDQEVSYHIIGNIGNRTIEFHEYNINISIDWNEWVEGRILTHVGMMILFIGIIFVIILKYVHYKKNRK